MPDNDSASKNPFLIALLEGCGHADPMALHATPTCFLARLLTLWSEHYQEQAERHLEVLGGRSPASLDWTPHAVTGWWISSLAECRKWNSDLKQCDDEQWHHRRICPQPCSPHTIHLQLVSHRSAIRTFSDDTTITSLITRGEKMAQREREVESLVTWCCNDNLHLNIDKTRRW